jgi:hypothetical protein
VSHDANLHFQTYIYGMYPGARAEVDTRYGGCARAIFPPVCGTGNHCKAL